jgi:hypothetical protein
MRPRVLQAVWIVTALVFVLLLMFEFAKWRSLSVELARAESERQRLTTEIRLKEQQLVAEMRKQSGFLQEMRWSSEGSDPAAFLTRMADLAREKRMTIQAIGPVERRNSPQFNKSWHSVQVQAPYREVRELAARVEQEKGILEEFRLEPAPQPSTLPPGAPRPPDEVRARFKLTSLELSPEAKLIINRTLAASGQSGLGSALSLPVPTASAPVSPAGRDPFAFVASAPPPRPTGSTGADGSEGPLTPVDVKGIVSFPDGFLAIVNNQIVKVGDTVTGYRVEKITERSVTLRQPGGNARTVNLPDLAPLQPAPTQPAPAQPAPAQPAPAQPAPPGR